MRKALLLPMCVYVEGGGGGGGGVLLSHKRANLLTTETHACKKKNTGR